MQKIQLFQSDKVSINPFSCNPMTVIQLDFNVLPFKISKKRRNMHKKQAEMLMKVQILIFVMKLQSGLRYIIYFIQWRNLVNKAYQIVSELSQRKNIYIMKIEKIQLNIIHHQKKEVKMYQQKISKFARVAKEKYGYCVSDDGLIVEPSFYEKNSVTKEKYEKIFRTRNVFPSCGKWRLIDEIIDKTIQSFLIDCRKKLYSNIIFFRWFADRLKQQVQLRIDTRLQKYEQRSGHKPSRIQVNVTQNPFQHQAAWQGGSFMACQPQFEDSNIIASILLTETLIIDFVDKKIWNLEHLISQLYKGWFKSKDNQRKKSNGYQYFCLDYLLRSLQMHILIFLLKLEWSDYEI